LKTQAEMGENMGRDGTVGAAPTPRATYVEDAPLPNADRTGKSPAFQFYPKDFLSSSKVQRMSLTERGAYVTLLSFCWLDGSLPADTKEIARILGVPRGHFSKLWAGPLRECFTEKNGRLINDRLESERKKQNEYRKQQSDRAGKGWAKRKLHESGNAVALQSVHQSGNALQSSSAFASASSPTVKTTTTPRGAPIHQKRNLHAAWEGSRGLYVVQGQHQKFVALLNNPHAELQLFAWYGEVSREWTDGARKHDNPGTDMVRFWEARHAEKWPVSQPVVNGKVAPGDAWRPEGQ
jgi:uncharacterized protein YdaU (DUF1376 family)